MVQFKIQNDRELVNFKVGLLLPQFNLYTPTKTWLPGISLGWTLAEKKIYYLLKIKGLV